MKYTAIILALMMFASTTAHAAPRNVYHAYSSTTFAAKQYVPHKKPRQYDTVKLNKKIRAKARSLFETF